jgi:indolepyruvate ferredoxin oxidoreductase
MPAHFTHDADFKIPGGELAMRIGASVAKDRLFAVDATEIAMALLGDSIAANLFTLGFAFQKGLVPIGAEAIETAVKLNGVSVKMNLDAFLWGRRAAFGETAVRKVAGGRDEAERSKPSLEAIIERRVAFLSDYQNRAYAETYREFVLQVSRSEGELTPRRTELTEAVALNLFKLMAYKDEYEVARLYSDGSFAASLARRFKGDYKLTFHLAPPILGRRDTFTKKPTKSQFGPWMMPVFRLLAKLKGLRGTRFDPFGQSEERRLERALIAEYKSRISQLLDTLSAANHAVAVAIASLPEQIRGFGHVKLAAIEKVKLREAELLAKSQEPAPAVWRAAE